MILVSGTSPEGCQRAFIELGSRAFSHFGPDLETASRGVGLLVDGVHYQTNPDPRSGAYLAPERWRRTLLRVTPRGLMRTDRAYLEAALVIVESPTVWDARWRAAGREGPSGTAWWAQVGGVLSDIRLRKYKSHVTTVEALARAGSAGWDAIAAWLDGASASRHDTPPEGPQLPAQGVTLDFLYRVIDCGGEVESAWLDELEDAHARDPGMPGRVT